MVSAVITWKGVSQPFFVGGNEIKVNRASYLKHLRDDLIPAVEAMWSEQRFHIRARKCSIALRQSSAKLPEAEVEVQIC